MIAAAIAGKLQWEQIKFRVLDNKAIATRAFQCDLPSAGRKPELATFGRQHELSSINRSEGSAEISRVRNLIRAGGARAPGNKGEPSPAQN